MNYLSQEIKSGETGKSLLQHFLILGFCLLSLGLRAQTYVTSGTMTGTPTAGSYYSNNSIVLTNFTFTASTGQSLRLYIQSDCIPRTTNFSTNQNYVLTSTPRINGFTIAGSLTNQGTCQVMQSIQYFDGLGRPIQTVQVNGSPNGNDLVQPIAYDQFGRETTKYLPYALTGTAVSDGSYKTNALTPGVGQAQFYIAPPTGVSPIPTPQAVTAFEPSPLNRVAEQGAPGDPWQLTGTTTPSGATPGHTTKAIYTINDGTNYWAKYYSVGTDVNGNNTLIYNGAYGVNQLNVTITQDENWPNAQNARLNTTEEYKDKLGHVVLKRTYNYTTVLQTLSTYYVYDDYGNLAYILPPGANPDGGLTSVSNQTTLNNLCYQYNYDSRNRLITKQLPGKGIEEMVYNLLDQLIFDRDAYKLSQNEWGFSKYDAQGRVIMTGVEKSNTSTRAALQTYVTYQLGIGTFAQWETPVATGGVQGYTNNCFPNSTNIVPLVIDYYDNYTFTGQPSTVAAPSGYSTKTIGLLTASKTAVLNTINNSTPDMLWTVRYYDDLGRVTQSYAQHYLGGILSPYNYDLVTNAYDFTNEITATTRSHYGTNTGNTAATLNATIANTYVYDHMSHKKQTLETINNGATIVLSQNDYNEIGQVMTKHLHSIDGGQSFLQNITYNHNERGWLTGNTAPLLSMQLQYNTNPNNVSGFTAQYNGNITSQIWTSFGQGSKNYVYSYDNLNRLVSGIGSDSFSESGISYDLGGNITALNRYQPNVQIDQLSYTYNNTNQVQSVNDLSTDNSQYGYRPGNYTGYRYDANGNMTVMPTPPDGKTLANINIQYNLLNLPQAITGGRSITYYYDANGTKLRRVSSNTGSTDYISGIQYDQASGATSPILSFMQTEEGKATPITSGGYDYSYYLSDNLGNTRVTFDTKTGSAVVQQQDDYYPFGYEISRGVVTNPKNEYLYNHKELQEELGTYDYGLRQYNPVIGRWGVPDPKAELLEMSSPYVYALNSPATFIDKDGELPIFIGGRVNSSSERASASYWDKELLNTISSSGIPNPGGTIKFVDGDVGAQYPACAWNGKLTITHNSYTSEDRQEAGEIKAEEDWQDILSQLEKDPNSGKIIEKIQIYTHSRGGAFGIGYTDKLIQLIKENSDLFQDASHEVDFVYNMADHQSEGQTAPDGVDEYSVHHDRDKFSGTEMQGVKGTFSTNEKSHGILGAHANSSFVKDTKAFLKAWQKNKGNSKKLIDDFVKTMKSLGITVTVKE